MYHYHFTPQCSKQFGKLPKNVRNRIIVKLDFYCRDNPFVYSTTLINSSIGSFRFRVGDYRIIFDCDEKDSLLILSVGHRREIYK